MRITKAPITAHSFWSKFWHGLDIDKTLANIRKRADKDFKMLLPADRDIRRYNHSIRKNYQ